ncbi:hypothetical protein J4218_03115 [Candidatus Pacearchaeota archaeon]|nr:hypothetical protein [Candidatus Pacearchaeota archaeon]
MGNFRAPAELEGHLVLGLLRESKVEYRCPHFCTDEIGPYCGRDLTEGQHTHSNISSGRRIICDSASMQLWCLDKDRYDNCLWYRGEQFRE